MSHYTYIPTDELVAFTDGSNTCKVPIRVSWGFCVMLGEEVHADAGELTAGHGVLALRNVAGELACEGNPFKLPPNSPPLIRDFAHLARGGSLSSSGA